MDAKAYKAIQGSIETGIRKAIACVGANLASDEMADLTQEAWVKVLGAFDATRGDMGGLAYKTAYNATMDALRARKPQADRPEGKDGETLDVEVWDANAHQEASRFPAPDAALLAKEKAAALAAAAERAGVTADLAAMLDGSVDLADGKMRVRKTRLQKKLAEELAE